VTNYSTVRYSLQYPGSVSSRFVEEDGTRLSRMVNAAVALLEIIERTRDDDEVTGIAPRALRA
jgi:hypothetical protein